MRLQIFYLAAVIITGTALGFFFYSAPLSQTKVIAEKVQVPGEGSKITPQLPEASLEKSLENTPGSCTGNWVFLPSIGYNLGLTYTDIASWNQFSSPSIIASTTLENNIVVMGHNECHDGNCNKPGTDFGRIIQADIDETGQLCINGKLYSGKVIFTGPVDYTATYILGNWLNKPTVTLFTCYGNCKDSACSDTQQRWTVSFERQH